MSASNLNHYFSGHPAVFSFWATLPLDNITLNPANKTIDQSLSDFQAGIGAAAHATLDAEQFISGTRTVLVDTVVTVQGSGDDVIAALEVHEILSKIPDIMDNAMSKWIGNMACIFA